MEPVTVQTILQDRFGTYLQNHRLPKRMVKAANGIIACRTAALGYVVERCPDLHHVRLHYRSCRGGSCPGCRFMRRERCIENHRARMLDCAHHHCVFTLPDELRILWRYNEALFSALLFATVSRTVSTLLEDDEQLGAQAGYLVALHTWGQTLQLHPHAHVLVTAGGLGRDGTWRNPKKDILIPFRLAQDFFRGAFLKDLAWSYLTGRIELPPDMSERDFFELLKVIRKKTWHVEVMERYEHPEGVLNYLTRYIRGGAIGNSRLVDYDGNTVTFSYVNNRDKSGGEPPTELMRLHVDEFITRLLQHVPPEGLKTFRGYGLYANAAAKGALPKARALLGQGPIQPPKKPSIEPYLEKMGRLDETRCPVCGKKLERVCVIAIRSHRSRGPPAFIVKVAA